MPLRPAVKTVALMMALVLPGIKGTLTPIREFGFQNAKKPDPYRRQADPWIGPAPVPVMEQVFWVELNRAPGEPLAVACPAGVTLLDQTKPGPGRRVTRLYFRADRGITASSLVIRGAGLAPLTVPLRVLSYREDIEDKVRDTPQLVPDARKYGRSFYTPEMISAAKANLRADPALRAELTASTLIETLGDEVAFQSLPSWNLPRQCYSTWPCPFCGEKIYEKSAFYPWKHTDRGAFRAVCPLCDRTFPTNDVTKDDFTSGDYPDDGWGLDLGAEADRARYAGWVAYHNHHALWQSTGRELKKLGERYLLLGDERAAHKAGVILARLAYVYPGMDMTWQQVQAGYLRPGRLLIDGNWERTGLVVPACQAYDAVFDFLDRDAELVRFLGRKDPAIKCPADVKALIETYFVQLCGWDWINRRLSGGNQGARERDAACVAVCADMGPVSDRWIEELFTRSYNSGLNKGGVDDEMMVNTLTREGITLVNGFGYALGYLFAKSSLAEVLSAVKSPRWRARCDLWDVRRYPKLRAEYDAWPEMLVAGDHVPCYGDDGSPRGATLPRGVADPRRTEYVRAYRRWPTDALARALAQAGPSAAGDLFEPNVWPQVMERVKRVGQAPPLGSRVLDGAGFVFLESRPEATERRGRAGLALRYGYGSGHHHQDNLNVEFWAKDLPLVPDLGYPVWAHPLGATGHVVHHVTGMIDRDAQSLGGGTAHGVLEGFAAAPEASFADVSAAPDGFPNRVYRRAVCLADAPGGNVYVLDILRLAGGTVRTYCFHGPAHRSFASNLEFGPKAPEAFDVRKMSRDLGKNLLEPQLARSDGDAFVDWLYDEKDVHLRVDFLGAPGRAYHTARYGKPDSPPIRFLLPEDEGADGASEFVALWQPYEGQPFIEKIERLQVTGGGAGGAGGRGGGAAGSGSTGGGGVSGEFAPVAVRVFLAGGRIDTLIYAGDATVPLRCGDIELQGSFGYWSEQDGKPRCLHLVNGTKLARNGVGVVAAPPPLKAKITAIDLVENRVTLDGRLPGDEPLPGRMLYLRAGPHRTAYRIAEVMSSGNAARLECNGLLFRSRLDALSSDRTTLTTELAPPIEAGRGIKPGYYDGALVTDETLRARYRVKRIAEGSIVLDRPVEEGDFADTDGDGRRLVYIYDHGEGDEVTLPCSVFLRRDGGKRLQLGSAELRGL